MASASQASTDEAQVASFAATQRSRWNSIGTTVEDASVCDVASIVTEYEEWSSRQQSLPNNIQMAEMVKSTSLRASLLSSRSIKQCSFLEHLEETTSSRDQSSISGNRGKRASYSMLISGFQPHSPSVNVKFGESLEDSALVPFDAPTAQATPKEGGHHTDTFVSPSRVGFVQWINAMQLGQNAFLIPLTYVFYQLGLTYYWQVAFVSAFFRFFGCDVPGNVGVCACCHGAVTVFKRFPCLQVHHQRRSTHAKEFLRVRPQRAHDFFHDREHRPFG